MSYANEYSGRVLKKVNKVNCLNPEERIVAPRKRKRKFRMGVFLAFLIFEVIFTAVTMPIMIFYGPFDNVKRTIVGASMNTLRHQYIAKFFSRRRQSIRFWAMT